MTSLPLSQLSLDSEPTMTLFPEFPLEVLRMILKYTIEPEIIKVNVTRYIEKNNTKSSKTVRGVVVQAGFVAKYKATSIPVHTDRAEFTREDGHQYQRSGLAFVSKEARKFYLEIKSAYIHLDTKGAKIYFNPNQDRLYFTDLTRFTMHDRRQRLRMPVPFLHGCENIKTIIYDEKTDDDRFEKLLPLTVGVFLESVKKIEQGVNFQNEKTEHWKFEVEEEHDKLVHVVNRADQCLELNLKRCDKVNGAELSPLVKVLRFPNL